LVVVLGEKIGGGLPSAIVKFELKVKAMGGFRVTHGFFISALYLAD
jgi:hypothetical protein